MVRDGVVLVEGSSHRESAFGIMCLKAVNGQQSLCDSATSLFLTLTHTHSLTRARDVFVLFSNHEFSDKSIIISFWEEKCSAIKNSILNTFFH